MEAQTSGTPCREMIFHVRRSFGCNVRRGLHVGALLDAGLPVVTPQNPTKMPRKHNDVSALRGVGGQLEKAGAQPNLTDRM